MATGVQTWSQTPATNATADSNVNWAEGMAPSAVNDSARAVMASVAKWNSDNNGTLLTSGSTTALTVQTNQVESALTSGYTVAVRFANTADVNATLAVDGLAAAPLQLYAGQNLYGGEFKANSTQRFTYSSTGTGQWIATDSKCLPIVTSTSTTINVTLSTGLQDGQAITLGTGTWYVHAAAQFYNNTGTASSVYTQLWDGTTMIANSGHYMGPVLLGTARATLNGIITNPAGPVKVSALAFNSGVIVMSATLNPGVFNVVDNGKMCSLTAIRIA